MPRSLIGLLGLGSLLFAATVSGSSGALAIGNSVSVRDIQISAQDHLFQAYTKKSKPKKKVWKGTRPDPSEYSLTIWPMMHQTGGPERSKITKYGLLKCDDGHNNVRKCRWQD